MNAIEFRNVCLMLGGRVVLDGVNLDIAPREFVAQGDKVVSLGHYRWRVKSTGQEYSSDFAHVFTVSDGKITGFQEYTDTASAARAYQRSAAA